MAFDPVTTVTSTALVIDRADIDTDQIIPARFLTTTSRDGLAVGAFADWRFNADGSPRPDDPFRDDVRKGAEILVAGENFGCGSSREHAPWALIEFGFRAVLAPKFGDIFRNNALKNGLLALEITADDLARLHANPSGPLTIDLAAQTISRDGVLFARFAIEPFAKECLMAGVDELGALLTATAQIAAFEAERGDGPPDARPGHPDQTGAR